MTGAHIYGREHIIMILPSLRHWRIRPPEDMFFSASISLKLRELENTKTSTITMRRDRKVMAVSEDMPCVASMLSNSVLNKQQGGHQSHKTKVHMYKIISATSSPLVVIEAVFFFFYRNMQYNIERGAYHTYKHSGECIIITSGWVRSHLWGSRANIQNCRN